MRRIFLIVSLVTFTYTGTAHAGNVNDDGSINKDIVKVHLDVKAPGVGVGGHSGGGSSRRLVEYDVVWSVDPTAAQSNVNGLCQASDVPGTVVPGFQFHIVGRDATGAIVDDRFQCIAFADLVDGRPTLAALPPVPTFAEAWNSVQLPAPAVTLDPATRGITGLDTRISTTGPATVQIAATIRGYTITGVATLDHYEISVDGHAATIATQSHFVFETKGNHTVAISAVWHGVATLAGGGLPNALPALDLGDATITSTRVYPVNEIRSVLQP